MPQAAPRGSYKGTLAQKNAYERSKVPKELCKRDSRIDCMIFDEVILDDLDEELPKTVSKVS